MRPEMFGQIGVNTAGDTAAWLALVSVANTRTDIARFEAAGEYLITGSTLIFTGIDTLVGRLHGAIFRQQSNYSKVFQVDTCGSVDIEGGHFYGRGGAAGEYNGASSSYNGVAAIYCTGCNDVRLWHIKGNEHAGGCLVALATRDRVSMCHNVIEGIGPTYIDPVGDGNQGNGSDFAMMCYPSTANPTSRGWVVEYEFVGNRTWNSAFGIQVVQSKSARISDNEIGPHQGQHGIYGIELDGLELTDNIFRECFQQGFKFQLENYAGRFVGSAWTTATAYAVGDQVRYTSNLWVCTTAHTSGGSFDSSKFAVDPWFRRNGGVISGNTFIECTQGIGTISTTNTDGRNIWIDGLVIADNKFLNCSNAGAYVDRLKNSVISDNLFQGGDDYGIFARDFSGSIVDNEMRGCGKNAILTTIAWTSFISDNRMIDCGLSGSGDDTRAIMFVPATTVAGIPQQASAPVVFARDNAIVFTTGDAAGSYLILSTDARVDWRLEGTVGSTTTKTCKIDGDLLYKFRNHFPRYFNTAQNEISFALVGHSDALTLTTSAPTLANTTQVLSTVIAVLGVKKLFTRT